MSKVEKEFEKILENITIPEKCCATVYPKDRYGSFHGYRCTRNATVNVDGKPYCRQHDPLEVERRNNESRIRYETKKQQRELEEIMRARRLLGNEIQELQFALLDLLDGQFSWYKIQEHTGCSDDRCKEIQILHGKIMDEVGDEWIRHNNRR